MAADETTGSAALGWATAVAGLIVAAIAPAWGQRSDATGGASNRQRRLGALTAVGVLVTAALALVRPHPSFLLLGLVLLAGGQVASQLAEVDHNALLRGVAPIGATGRVSGLGTAALHLDAVAVVGGILDDRLGPKVIIVGSLTGVIVALIMILVIHGRGELWVCALVAAAFIGPTMSASRSYLARAAPPQQQGQLFGLYTCTGRVVSFVAPAAFALGVSILGGQRWGMLGITVVLLAGLLAVLPVRAVDYARVSPHTEDVAA